jgi:hypothetical protein
VLGRVVEIEVEAGAGLHDRPILRDGRGRQTLACLRDERQLVRPGRLTHEHIPRGRGQGDGLRLPVLRHVDGAPVETPGHGDAVGRQVDVRPAEFEQLARSHAGVGGEDDQVPHLRAVVLQRVAGVQQPLELLDGRRGLVRPSPAPPGELAERVGRDHLLVYRPVEQRDDDRLRGPRLGLRPTLGLVPCDRAEGAVPELVAKRLERLSGRGEGRRLVPFLVVG